MWSSNLPGDIFCQISPGFPPAPLAWDSFHQPDWTSDQCSDIRQIIMMVIINKILIFPHQTPSQTPPVIDRFLSPILKKCWSEPEVLWFYFCSERPVGSMKFGQSNLAMSSELFLLQILYLCIVRSELPNRPCDDKLWLCSNPWIFFSHQRVKKY